MSDRIPIHRPGHAPGVWLDRGTRLRRHHRRRGLRGRHRRTAPADRHGHRDPALRRLPGCPPLSSLVFGGHDTADCPLPKRAEALAAGGRAAARAPRGRRAPN